MHSFWKESETSEGQKSTSFISLGLVYPLPRPLISNRPWQCRKMAKGRHPVLKRNVGEGTHILKKFSRSLIQSFELVVQYYQYEHTQPHTHTNDKHKPTRYIVRDLGPHPQPTRGALVKLASYQSRQNADASRPGRTLGKVRQSIKGRERAGDNGTVDNIDIDLTASTYQHSRAQTQHNQSCSPSAKCYRQLLNRPQPMRLGATRIPPAPCRSASLPREKVRTKEVGA